MRIVSERIIKKQIKTPIVSLIIKSKKFAAQKLNFFSQFTLNTDTYFNRFIPTCTESKMPKWKCRWRTRKTCRKDVINVQKTRNTYNKITRDSFGCLFVQAIYKLRNLVQHMKLRHCQRYLLSSFMYGLCPRLLMMHHTHHIRYTVRVHYLSLYYYICFFFFFKLYFNTFRPFLLACKQGLFKLISCMRGVSSMWSRCFAILLYLRLHTLHNLSKFSHVSMMTLLYFVDKVNLLKNVKNLWYIRIVE